MSRRLNAVLRWASYALASAIGAGAFLYPLLRTLRRFRRQFDFDVVRVYG